MTEAEFAADGLACDAVERCLQRISGAAVKLGRLAEDEIPQQPWAAVRNIGNVLRREHDRVDSTVLWTIVRERLPQMRDDILSVIRKLDSIDPTD